MPQGCFSKLYDSNSTSNFMELQSVGLRTFHVLMQYKLRLFAFILGGGKYTPNVANT